MADFFYTGPSAGPLVEQGWDLSQQYANDAFSRAQGFLDDLSSAITSVTAIPGVPASPYIAVDDMVADYRTPAKPEVPDSDFSGVNIPSAPDIDIPSDFDLPAQPQFLAQFPSLSFPSRPAPLDVDAPGTAPSITDLDVPDAPTITLPDVPTLRELTDLDAPDLETLKFEGEAPADDLKAPANTFSFTEEDYTSPLLTDLKSKLSGGLSGGTGLDSGVWNQIWDRERSREDAAAKIADDEALRSFAARGWSRPTGALSEQLAQNAQKRQDQYATASRDQAIKEVDIEFQWLTQVVNTAVSLEGQLIQYTNQQQQRAFEVEKTNVELGIAVFNTEVALYNARVDAYRQFVEIYKTRVEAQLNELEKYKAQLEAQRIKSQLNQQDIDIYRARIEALQSIADVYRSEVEGFSARVNVDRTKIDAFLARVQSYAEQVRAKTAEYEGYAAGIRGEVARTDAYRTQADAYRAEVDGYRAIVDAESTKKRTEIETGRLEIDAYNSQLEAIRAKIQAERDRLDALARVFEGQSSQYAAETGAETARMNAESRKMETLITNARNQADFELSRVELAINRARYQAQLLADISANGAQVSTGLASAALSAVNLSGSIGLSESYSY